MKDKQETVYEEEKEGEWIQPRRRHYYMKCCKCGLVHTVDLRLVKNKRGNFIQMRFWLGEKE